jgi:predicted SAM-dependent methyltransferase
MIRDKVSETAIYANLGCGNRYRTGWVNIDIQPASDEVRAHDLSQGIPLPDRSCAVVYHSHVLEHLRPGDARSFLRECFRVLQPEGVMRLATPDLERICRDYLATLQAIDRGEPHAQENAEWMRLELYDQTVRESSGGAMLQFFQRSEIPNMDFVRGRIGLEADEIHQSTIAQSRRPGLRDAAAAALALARRAAITAVAGRNGHRAYDIGRFRLGGEVHQWLYDRHSIVELLRSCGFADPRIRTATDSRIPDWSSFHLDASPDGTPIKRDSMYVEGIRPAG